MFRGRLHRLHSSHVVDLCKPVCPLIPTPTHSSCHCGSTFERVVIFGLPIATIVLMAEIFHDVVCIRPHNIWGKQVNYLQYQLVSQISVVNCRNVTCRNSLNLHFESLQDVSDHSVSTSFFSCSPLQYEKNIFQVTLKLLQLQLH